MQPPPQTPQFRGPLESAFRHRGLVLLPVLALVAAGAVIGLLREPDYEAEARVSVGRVDAPVYTLDELLIANTTLARNYARLVGAEPVVEPAASSVGIDASDARDDVSGSPLPGSSLISVEAKGDSEAEAVALANATSRALITYVEDLNRRQESGSLLNRFRDAARQFDAARRRLQRLQRQGARPAAVDRARLDFFTQQARTEAIRLQYRNNEGGLPPEGLLQLALPAVDADSDRWSVLQQLMLIGLGAGLVLGLGLALLRENRALLSRARA
jgi:uncharacterized protein involved in exopolysaccharide biosynthesis